MLSELVTHKNYLVIVVCLLNCNNPIILFKKNIRNLEYRYHKSKIC